MGRLFFAFILYLLFGWLIPRWGWGAVPIAIGSSMMLLGCLGMLASFRVASATAGLGAVFVAFLGFLVLLFGMVIIGHEDWASVLLSYIGAVPMELAVGGGLLFGFVISAIMHGGE